jgi:hypothetical protein
MEGLIFNVRISVQSALAKRQESWRVSKTRQKYEGYINKGKNLRN